MTGSFSCMTLTALLVFDTASHADKAQWIDDIVAMGDDVIAREDTLQSYIADDFDRITYLGSGSLGGLTREAQLKILELTAGQVATVFDTSMGFLAEIDGDHIAQRVVAIGQDAERHFAGDNFLFNRNDVNLPEAYLALPDVMVAQTLALLTSVKIGNKPDTPSPTGTVNRVVKGVILHDYKA
jgi:tagatose-6-phosphate ketose/aldose isomerase